LDQKGDLIFGTTSRELSESSGSSTVETGTATVGANGGFDFSEGTVIPGGGGNSDITFDEINSIITAIANAQISNMGDIDFDSAIAVTGVLGAGVTGIINNVYGVKTREGKYAIFVITSINPQVSMTIRWKYQTSGQNSF